MSGPKQISDLINCYWCSSADGSPIHRLGARRNRRPFLNLAPGWENEMQRPEEQENADPEFLKEICQNLSPSEAKVWLMLLETSGVVTETAARLGVSRQAVLFRIRGDKRTPGMIQKNEYVAIWWRLRNKKKRS